MTAPRLMLIVSLLGVAVAGYLHAYSMGKREGVAETTARWTQERLALKQAQLEEVQRAVQIEHHLTEKIAKVQQEAVNEKNRIAAQYERTIAGLRNRPEARAGDSGVPQGAAPGAGCTGAGLARPDAGFLAGYAADAARLQSALSTCVGQYGALKQALDEHGLKSGHHAVTKSDH